MTVIKKDDFINSVANAFQYISYYHPKDFVDAVYEAWQKETNQSAKNAMGQILTNSRMSAMGHRPICQDTGSAVVFLDIGMNVQWDLEGDTEMSVEDMVNEGVRRAYNNPDNPLRASILVDPISKRQNTKDNTPAVVHMSVVPGDKVDVICAAKGGGSENKAKFAMLNPSDSIEEWVLKTVPQMGAGWCPPGILGIGVGGTPEKAMMLAKRSLMEHIDIHELQAKAQSGAELDSVERLRLNMYDKVNELGVGAQGLGGLTTVLDVKVLDFPTHAASKAVAMIPNCAATRHIHFTLDGQGEAALPVPSLSDWPEVSFGSDDVIKVNVNDLTKETLGQFNIGDTLLLSGKILTGRDAAHKRMVDMLAKGEALPVDLQNRFIYYVGPVDAVGDEVVGPAGPTTSTRMDKFTDTILDQGLIGMIGKSERSPATCEVIAKHGAIYLIAVGGAAYLVSKAIKGAKVLAFPELGMEAIYEFKVEDMPVTVAVDNQGNSIHRFDKVAERAQQVIAEPVRFVP
ncbi:MAG: fumarate hydratase [Moraxella sp.]|jgi:fumarate hydratase, class I|nr:fumarate hydratase [Moraxella osloensis]MBP6340848.1 fumarate hydratase [Moraxella sp.]MBP6485592.1 fumarate hydratase [Moraxella sp.]MBP7234074.1 fumarate hydratase [Moraxella sp.]